MVGIQVLAVVAVLAFTWQQTSAGHAYSQQHISTPVVGAARKIIVSDGHHGHGKQSFDYVAYPKYHNSYVVADGHTGDHHSHQESRDGDRVTGHYKLREADGSVRIVHYVADKGGYRAHVEHVGHR